ncbi:UDP-glycosyltransferase UGT5 [Amyelois transitella]|uniref:UDP-glycosyltransferase UGT5 n=1 Tax=Amyelois transitella TaxID=680683 RepID=UPI00067CE8B4|nr:UDP-glycosyltransferase UGT5 [Amyelois transitella]
MIARAIVCLISWLFLLHNAAGLNILAIVSLPLRSHYMAFKPLFRELATRGHNVTVINNYPDDEPLQNLTFINLESSSLGTIPLLHERENSDSTYWYLVNYFRHLYYSWQMNSKDCDNLFNSKITKTHQAEGVHYDVIFVEQFMSDCALAYAAAFYEAPIIGITSHVMLPWAYARLGLSFDVSSDPFYFSTKILNKSLYQKVEDCILHFVFTTVGRWFIQRRMYETFEPHVPRPVDIEEVARDRMRMMFVYQHFSLTGARAMSPQVLEIGGIHIGESKPVPKDIEDFLSTAEQGAIYFSFGSNLQLSTMSPQKMQKFLEAFKSVPQKVLWKWENDTFPAGYEGKIYPRKWFPQLDVLCHPKVKAFISHGGMLSLSEAAHCGKPVLAVPFFGDQFSNAAVVVSSGLGNTLMFDRINETNLGDAIRELTSEKMQRSAQQISKMWHDRPQKVMDSAIYWIEYVTRYDTALPSLPAQQNTWFENLQLDVYAVLLLIVLMFLLIFYFIVKLFILILIKLIRLVVGTKKVKTN